MKPIIYCPQIPKIRNEAGVFQDKFDLTPAKEWGRVYELVSSSANPLKDPEDILAILHEELSKYTNNDFILCMGSPVIIGWTIAIAALYNNGQINTLQWNGIKGKYEPLTARLWQ